jgi:hypothetical protein
MRPVFVIFSLLCALVMSASVYGQQRKPSATGGGARVYKCVDATGKVYYSDKMNPDCAEGSELSRQGVVMDSKPASTGQPKPRQGAKAEDDSTKVKKTKEQERRDRALLATYTSEQEIDVARERSLAIPMQGIKTTEAKLDKANNQLQELKKQADRLAGQKKAIPPHLLEDVNVKQKEVSRLEAELAQRKSNAEAIHARYEADKARYRELKVSGK